VDGGKLRRVASRAPGIESAAALTVVLLGVVLAGCSASEPPPANTDDAPVAVSTPTLTPTPTPTGVSFSGTAAQTNEDGYTGTIDFHVELGEPEISIVNDKPGEGTVTMTVDSLVRLTNTTTGRDFPASSGAQHVRFHVVALYQVTETAPYVGRCDAGMQTPNFISFDDGNRYCALSLAADTQVQLWQPLSPGQSSGNLSPNPVGYAAVTERLEADLEGLAARLSHPSFVMVVGPNWDPGLCTFGIEQIVASSPAMPGCT
jgi:hypothetical protein